MVVPLFWVVLVVEEEEAFLLAEGVEAGAHEMDDGFVELVSFLDLDNCCFVAVEEELEQKY